MTEQTPTRRPRKMAREPQADAPNTNAPAIKSSTTKTQTKASVVEALLLKDCGTSLADLCQATNWLPHTCRAFLTGLRKKGRALHRTKRDDGTTIYQLAPIEAAA
jgi:hypothetical protein